MRYRAATTLGAWADQRVSSYSLSLLRDDDPDTQAEACSVVWRFRLPEVAGAKYEQALHDDSAEETENATSVLMDFQDPRCGELNLALLQREDSNESNLKVFRYYAIQQLATWRPPDFGPLRLRPLLHDQNPLVRATAALVAGQVQALALVDELRLLLKDESTVATNQSEALDRTAGKRGPWQPFRRSPVRPR